MKQVFFVAMAVLICLCLFLAWRSRAVRGAAFGLVAMVRERRFGLPLAYLIYGAIAVPCIGLLMPPYQAADEGAHFFRADQVGLGVPLGYRAGKNSGGAIDRGAPATYGLFYPIVLHQERKVTTEMFRQAENSTWREGKDFYDFANTSFYPPYFYIVAAVTIDAGKLAQLSVIDTLYVARLLNGFVALGLGALAIAVAGTAAPWFFALLCLPMSLAQASSVSQDGLLFPTAALAAAMFIRGLRERDGNAYDFALMCVLLALAATGRVTYGTLALLPLALGDVRPRARLLGAALVAAVSLGWSGLASTFALVQFGPPEASAPEQVHYLLSHPAAVFSVAANTMRFQYDLYLESFIGKLGWLDLSLPPLYIELAWAVLAAAALASLVSGAGDRSGGRVFAIVALALASSVAALFAALYVSWTPVGNFIVDGVQGRYFIPLAFFVPAIFPLGARPVLGRLNRALTWLVAAFPIVSITVVILGILQRYYMA